MILLFLITPTIRELIVATPIAVLSIATGLSALAPAQRAGAQRLCALAQLRSTDGLSHCQLIEVDRTLLSWPPR
jgi:hypothetical protein